MMEYKFNPKMEGSGMVACCPQTGYCPVDCPDCFFNSKRSYLEPITEKLPNIPLPGEVEGQVVRMNDVHDSNIKRDLVIQTAHQFVDFFFNTSINEDLEGFPGPVMLTVNPGEMTDTDVHFVHQPPPNLMSVRVRVNAWNRELVDAVVDYYTHNLFRKVPVKLTYMAYYNVPVPEEYADSYEFKRRTMNEYWCLTEELREAIEDRYQDNPLVYACTVKGSSLCKDCGHCLREYWATKERMKRRF